MSASAYAPNYDLVARGVDCATQNAPYLGQTSSVNECADKCKANAGCRFFAYGTGTNAGKCWRKDTASRYCPDGGFSPASLDFYAMPPPRYSLLRAGYECTSADTWLGAFETADGGASACFGTADCNYFIYRSGSKAGDCYAEHATSPECPQAPRLYRTT